MAKKESRDFMRDSQLKVVSAWRKMVYETSVAARAVKQGMCARADELKMQRACERASKRMQMGGAPSNVRARPRARVSLPLGSSTHEMRHFVRHPRDPSGARLRPSICADSCPLDAATIGNKKFTHKAASTVAINDNKNTFIDWMLIMKVANLFKYKIRNLLS